MNGTTHMVIGGLTGGLVLALGVADRTMSFNFFDYQMIPVVVTVAGAMGGLAPDIDMARSTAGRFLRNVLRAGLIASAVFLAAMYFIPRTGIGFLDRAVNMGAGIDRNILVILIGFCIALLFIVDKVKHRGFTHTMVALIIIAAPLVYMITTKAVFVGVDIVISAQAGFALGWLSHLVIDTFNYPGTPWLWPVVDKHFNIMRVDSGTNDETIFLMIASAIFIAVYAFIIM